MPERIKCPKCGVSNTESHYFCKECGAFLREDLISEPEIYESAQFKIMRLIENLKNNYPHEKIIWDDTVDLYARQIERLEALTVLPEIDNRTLSDEMDVFLSRCRNPEFQIAFVGTIKTGKSTLINALLGKNYASMDVTPETASLTKFRYSKQDYIKVRFYSPKEWNKLWRSLPKDEEKTEFEKEYEKLHAKEVEGNFIGKAPIQINLDNNGIQEELMRWSSSRYPEHFFVKEVEVGISTLPDDFPPQVVFVDTPGLQDRVQYRSDITTNYIKSADAVFVCVEAKKIESPEIDTISSVLSISSNRKEKVYIVATQWDILNDPKNDWIKQEKYYVETLGASSLFANKEIVRNHLFYSAALIENICRDFDLSDKKKHLPLARFALSFGMSPDSEELKKNLQTFREYSNIERIRKTIESKLVMRHAELLRNDIVEKYKGILGKMYGLQKEKSDKSQDLIETCGASVNVIEEKLRKKKAEIEDNLKDQKSLKNASTSLEKRAKEILDHIYSLIEMKQKRN